MILGITGSEYGCNEIQYAALASRIRHPSVIEVHHGDCVGVDAIAHEIALAAGKRIVIHPPSDPRKRAWCAGPPGQVTILEPRPYLDRNHDIVVCSDELIAVPIELVEVKRSGTWATVRYARERAIPIEIIYAA